MYCVYPFCLMLSAYQAVSGTQDMRRGRSRIASRRARATFTSDEMAGRGEEERRMRGGVCDEGRREERGLGIGVGLRGSQ